MKKYRIYILLLLASSLAACQLFGGAFNPKTAGIRVFAEAEQAEGCVVLGNLTVDTVRRLTPNSNILVRPPEKVEGELRTMAIYKAGTEFGATHILPVTDVSISGNRTFTAFTCPRGLRYQVWDSRDT